MRWLAAQALAWIMRQEPLKLCDWKSDMGPDIGRAQEALAKAIGEGRVHAWGRPTPFASFEQLPGDPFRIPNLTVIVGPHGDMTTLLPHQIHQFHSGGCPRWHDIELDSDEIKREWPEPPPPTAMEWMQKVAEQLYRATGQLGKREDLIFRCMLEVRCTKRQAEAAHKALPQDLRRKRGKPPKS